MTCPSCGKPIPEDSVFCSSCGEPVVYSSDDDSNKEKAKHRKKLKNVVESGICKVDPKIRMAIPLACLLLAIVFVAIGIRCVTSEKYDFYSQHYAECKEGYEECKQEARTGSYFFQYTYESLADSYQEMMRTDRAKLWGMRIQAVVWIALAVWMTILSYALYLMVKAMPDSVIQGHLRRQGNVEERETIDLEPSEEGLFPNMNAQEEKEE